VSFAIVSPTGANKDFAIDTSVHYSLQAVKQRIEWDGLGSAQLPSIVKLRLLSPPGRSTYYLNISASDNGQPIPRIAYTQLKVLVREERKMQARFSQREYTANFTRTSEIGSDLIVNQQISAVFPSKDVTKTPIVYEMMSSDYSELFSIDQLTARLRLAKQPPEDIPPVIELEVTAYPMDEPDNRVSTRLLLNDVTEVRLTHFAQCHYEAHLLENPSAYTRVLQFTFRGDVEGVELLNGTSLFQVDEDGTMSVRPGVEIDREQTQKIVVKARLKVGTIDTCDNKRTGSYLADKGVTELQIAGVVSNSHSRYSNRRLQRSHPALRQKFLHVLY